MNNKTALVILGATLAITCAVLAQLLPSRATETPACPPLPTAFTQYDLVGTWVAEYFGGAGVDQLFIRDDGLFRQVFSDSTRDLESEWQEWRLEFDPAGYALLHLEGMHRCDDVESICDDPGGGLPADVWAVDPCKNEVLHMSDEVILFVVGAPDLSRGIELRHARMGGTRYYYTFRLTQ